jgi:hypothetical protein
MWLGVGVEGMKPSFGNYYRLILHQEIIHEGVYEIFQGILHNSRGRHILIFLTKFLKNVIYTQNFRTKILLKKKLQIFLAYMKNFKILFFYYYEKYLEISPIFISSLCNFLISFLYFSIFPKISSSITTSTHDRASLNNSHFFNIRQPPKFSHCECCEHAVCQKDGVDNKKGNCRKTLRKKLNH